MRKQESLIRRHKINPKLWDFSYLILKNDLAVFDYFKNLCVKSGTKRILDVGCGSKPWSSLFDHKEIEYLGIDLNKEISSADFFGTANNLPFNDDEFDALVYSEVLEHVEEIEDVLKEMRRVVKNEGLVFISAPFIFPEHGVPYDFWRFSRYFYEKSFKNDEILSLQESNSSFATVLGSINLAIESTFLSKIPFKYFIYIFNNMLSITIDYFLGFFKNIFTTRSGLFNAFYSMPLGYAVVVRIRKGYGKKS